MPNTPSGKPSELQQLKFQLRVRDAADRVLDRALAMRHTSELQDVINEVGTELRALDLDITGGTFISINDEVGPDLYVWGYGGTANYARRVRVPFIDQPIFTGLVNRITGTETGLYTEAYSREEKIAFFKHLFSHAPYNQTSPEHQAEVLSREGGYVRSCYLSEYTSLFIINHHGRKFSDRDHGVLMRFGEIFEKSYRRFLDLQKAEQQAREAQIEAALERVRASAMGMRSSDELSDVLSVMFNQFDALGIQPVYGCLDLFNLENNTFTHIITGRAGHRHPVQQVISLEAIDIWKKSVESWQNGDPETVQLLHYPPERMGEVWDVFDELFDSLPKKARFDRNDFPNGIFSVAGYHKHGYIGFMHHRKSTEEEVRIVLRFSKEFDRLYQRFLDLQKAEQQAREAQIEAALERVRSKSMGMRSSDELLDLVSLVFHELTRLDMELTRCIIWTFEPDHTAKWWMLNPENREQAQAFSIPNHDHPAYQAFLDAWRQNEKSWEYELSGEGKKTWDEYLFSKTDLVHLPGYVIEGMKMPDKVILTASFSDFGALQTAGLQPLSPENREILKRFGQLFDQSYTRFLDLQKAETQAREAQIEAALERVRSRMMAIQKSAELKDVIQVVFDQLASLDFNVEHAGFIMDYKVNDDMHIWLADPNGVQPEISIPYFDSPHWNSFLEAKGKGKQFFTNLLDFEEKNSFYKKLFRHIPDLPEETADFYFSCPGLAISTVLMDDVGLYIENFSGKPYTDEENRTLMRFGTIFQQTYTRFLDLKQAEEQELLIRREKERLEKTLAELRATQAQLIHAEKMASLGELTAGIAHEIKNPLNFINNFSDVSTELLDEVVEELNNGDHKEALLIIEDLKTNLQRIVGHGRRADSIVNGMLMHSRGDSQGREMSDLNALCDEYLRLAYHGLRARDKSFNAEMQTDFDDALPNANVAPQQIGRVLLNLITNAFHAVSEKSSEAGAAGFHPLVTVKTARHEGAFRITVSDNGNGIPDNILDKIFQPFFTTKPTGSGTGLGLSISYDIVKAHGGSISVHSRAGEGTDFVVSLPMSGE